MAISPISKILSLLIHYYTGLLERLDCGVTKSYISHCVRLLYAHIQKYVYFKKDNGTHFYHRLLQGTAPQSTLRWPF